MSALGHKLTLERITTCCIQEADSTTAVALVAVSTRTAPRFFTRTGTIPHGMLTTRAEVINKDMLAFFRSSS